MSYKRLAILTLLFSLLAGGAAVLIDLLLAGLTSYEQEIPSAQRFLSASLFVVFLGGVLGLPAVWLNRRQIKDAKSKPPAP